MRLGTFSNMCLNEAFLISPNLLCFTSFILSFFLDLYNLLVYTAGLELAWVPRVPGTRGIFGQYCLAPSDFGNFTTVILCFTLEF